MDKKGSALIVVLTVFVVLSLLGAALLKVTIGDSKLAQRQLDHQKSLFLAESGIQRAAWLIKQDTGDSLKAYVSIPYSTTFQLKGDDTALNTMEEENIAISILYLGNEMYQISSTSQFSGSSGGSDKVENMINTFLEENSPAKVFDYSYFINNWGWFYGGPITSYGDVRSNGKFSFKYGPTVEGEIYSAYEVDIDGTINGFGAQAQYQHPYSKSVPMPNLNDLSYYESVAAGSVVVGSTTLIDGVLGDDGGENENIVLIGTATDPIEINGTVVVRGDVIVSGVITGQGTLYSGRNLYVPNNITYDDGPTTEKPTYPGGGPPDSADISSWVASNDAKDLVGFAATESVILGDYTKSSNQWIFDNYLYNMGSEDVGQDGIPDTGDTGEDNDVFESAYEDIDGDGVEDGDYTSAEVATQAALTTFDNLPEGYTTYEDIVTNPDTYTAGTTTMEGIFYTNHAMSGRPEGDCVINGSIISKDEAIGINSIVINYDWRIHSEYTSGADKIIDLPYSKKVEVTRWWQQ